MPIESVDPRIRRTRQMLHQALTSLLETKDFDKISVGEIADLATVNRATFYDHYPDKVSLLECVVAGRFHELLKERKIGFDSCASALRGMALALGDYLTRLQGPDKCRPLEPRMEMAIISVMRQMLLEGLMKHPSEGIISKEVKAAAASWGLYGVAKEWLHTVAQSTTEEMADRAAILVSGVLSAKG